MLFFLVLALILKGRSFSARNLNSNTKLPKNTALLIALILRLFPCVFAFLDGWGHLPTHAGTFQ
jgi:hypothetical protein